MKRKVRLTESDLHRLIKESVKGILKESQDDWNLRDEYSEDEMFSLINTALSSLNKARDYARKNGNGNIYELLNEIMTELWDLTH